jgi:hypothetical protein
MTELGTQVIVVAVVVLLTVAPAVAAGWLLMQRKRRARQRRRSPLTADLLRSPGQTLREELEERRSDSMVDLLTLMIVPSVSLAVVYGQAVFNARVAPLGVLVVVAVSVAAFIAHRVRLLYRRGEQMDRLRLGLDAELAVGQELDQLMRDGAVVFHDVPGEKFDVDHVVVAPQGVFAVETKGYSKPTEIAGKAGATVVFDGKALMFPDRSGAKAIDQARRQAKWLADWLARATSEPVHVTPVLALPGWFVERKGRGDVHVFSGKELRKHLLGLRQAQPVVAEQMQRIAHQLEQRCRTVRPEYRADEPAS